MVLGDAHAWATKFISVDERILERIAYVWPQCATLLPGQPEEDTITIQLIDHLAKDQIVRRICHWIEYQYEPFGIAPSGQKFSKGKIDLAILLDWERERYIAYECKRLNVRYKGIKQSLATAYVADGLMRFITEQYAENLPVGCMIGYVMDGDCPSAIKSVHSAIVANADANLQRAPLPLAPVSPAHRFYTNHLKGANGTVIEIRHAFLPF
jgi:hypothetical protein